MIVDGTQIFVEFRDEHCIAWMPSPSWRGRIGFCVSYTEANDDPLLAEKIARNRLVQCEHNLLEHSELPFVRS